MKTRYVTNSHSDALKTDKYVTCNLVLKNAIRYMWLKSAWCSPFLSSAVRTFSTLSSSYMQLGLFFSGTKTLCPLGISSSTTRALCIEYGLEHARRCKVIFAASSSMISGAQWHVCYMNLQTIGNNILGSVGNRLITTIFKHNIELFDIYLAVKVYSFH